MLRTGSLPPLRRPSRARLRRRSEADGLALLHRRIWAGVSSGGAVSFLRLAPGNCCPPGNCAPVPRTGVFS
jgi:hypothetical protein